MSKPAASKKAAATAALLGEPVSAAADQPAAKKKKVKKEDGAAGGGASLEKQLISLLTAAPKGLSQDDVCAALGGLHASDILEPINNLLNKHRVELMQDGGGKIFYKIVSQDKVAKLAGLSASEILLYQLVEKSGNLGVWIKDLRRKSNLSVIEIPKLLKELMKRKLIKCEKSVAATNKKVYMLYDIEPAREVSGGAWYDKATGEFDSEYMAALEGAAVRFLEKKAQRRLAERERMARNPAAVPAATEAGAASALEVQHFLTETGAFKTLPSEDETRKILEGLVYEGRLEREVDDGAEWGVKDERKSAMAAAAASASTAEAPSRKRRRAENTYLYRFVVGGAFQSSFAQIPCSNCPVARSCQEGNPISPQSCQYLKQWMEF